MIAPERLSVILEEMLSVPPGTPLEGAGSDDNYPATNCELTHGEVAELVAAYNSKLLDGVFTSLPEKVLIDLIAERAALARALARRDVSATVHRVAYAAALVAFESECDAVAVRPENL